MNRKRFFISFLLIFSLIISQFLFYSKSTSAAKKDTQKTNTSDDSQAALTIDAKAAVLIENTTGRILYAKNENQKLIPASITKIMTLLLIFDALDNKKIKLEDTVTVSEYAAGMGGSQVFLEAGETQTVKDMIKCISIVSANDACVAMAEHISGSETAFVKAMNQKAKKLGMKNTHFKNCNGLDDTIQSGHYTSAYDVALMSRELITRHPEISDYSTVWMDSITHSTKKGTSEFGLSNTNKLIRTYQGITGLKTGSTAKAKYCLSATACRNQVNLTAVVMAAKEPRIRFSEAAKLLDYGFANCTVYKHKSTNVTLKPQKVTGSVNSYVTPRIEKDFSCVLDADSAQTTDKKNAIRPKIIYEKNLTAPIKEGDTIGTLYYVQNGETLGTVKIVSAENVNKAGLCDFFKALFKAYLP